MPRDPDQDDPDRLNCFFFVLRTKRRNCLAVAFISLALFFNSLACGLPYWSLYPATTNAAIDVELNTFERSYSRARGLICTVAL